MMRKVICTILALGLLALPACTSHDHTGASEPREDAANMSTVFQEGTPEQILNDFVSFAAAKTEPDGTPMADQNRALFTQQNAYSLLTGLPADYTIQSISVQYGQVTVDYAGSNDNIAFRFGTAPPSYAYDFTNWAQRTVEGKSYYVSEDPYSDLVRICWEEGGYYFYLYLNAAEGENYDSYFAYCNPEKLALPQPDVD